MDITPYVERLREHLAQAASAGDDQIRDAADRLTLALDPSMRLALMEAVSQAAAEITTEMRAGSVDVRLNGRDLEFVVDSPPAPETVTAAPTPSAPGEDDEEDGATARITLRLPESIKTRAEELAAKGSSSLNTWIVNVLRNATRENAINIDIDLSSIPFGTEPNQWGPPGRRGKRMTGWV